MKIENKLKLSEDRGQISKIEFSEKEGGSPKKIFL